MCSERKDKPQTLRAVMRPIAAPFFLLTELVGPPSRSSARPSTVTVVSQLPQSFQVMVPSPPHMPRIWKDARLAFTAKS